MSDNDKIIKTLEGYGEWLPSFKLMNAKTPYGWIGKSGDRRCRELAEKGIIERRLNGKYVEYRATENKPKLPRFTRQESLFSP